jgi:hypothetical protein
VDGPFEKHGSVSLTCRYFGISRPTFYRARGRYDAAHLSSLEDRSSRPRRTRKPTWSPELVAAVRQERERFPRWGKEKIATLLREEGWEVSTSMVGRILGDLERRNVLKLPCVSASRCGAVPHHALTRCASPRTGRCCSPVT